jgi:hypothetical protein
MQYHPIIIFLQVYTTFIFRSTSLGALLPRDIYLLTISLTLTILDFPSIPLFFSKDSPPTFICLKSISQDQALIRAKATRVLDLAIYGPSNEGYTAFLDNITFIVCVIHPDIGANMFLRLENLFYDIQLI